MYIFFRVILDYIMLRLFNNSGHEIDFKLAFHLY